MVERTLREATSTRATRRSSPRSAQASPPPNATSQGWLAKGMPPTTSCERASINPSDFGGISSRAGSASPPPRRRTTPDHGGGGGDRRDRQRPEGAAAAPPGAARALAPERRRARLGERAAAREPVVGRLRHGRHDDGVERRGDPRPGLAGERRRFVHVGVHGRQLALASERRLAGQALEEHAAQGVDVRPRVDRGALDLLGGDVGDRADEVPVAGEARDRGDVLGEPEVAQVGVLAGVRASPRARCPASRRGGPARGRARRRGRRRPGR